MKPGDLISISSHYYPTGWKPGTSPPTVEGRKLAIFLEEISPTALEDRVFWKILTETGEANIYRGFCRTLG